MSRNDSQTSLSAGKQPFFWLLLGSALFLILGYAALFQKSHLAFSTIVIFAPFLIAAWVVPHRSLHLVATLTTCILVGAELLGLSPFSALPLPDRLIGLACLAVAVVVLALERSHTITRFVLPQSEETTESKTELLARQTLFLNGVLESAPVAILKVSAAGGICFLNQQARELIPTTAANQSADPLQRAKKMTWQQFSLLLRQEEQDAFCQALERARSQPGTILFQGSVRNESPDQEKILQFRIAALQPGAEQAAQTCADSEGQKQEAIGSTPECIVLVLDVTREKMAEAELEAEQMRSIQSAKMATLGEMAGGIAHEINNPLAIVDLCAQQLEIMLQSGSLQTEIIERNTRKIRTTIQRIATIVRGLKSFARDTSRDPLREESPTAIVTESLALCEARLRNQSIVVTSVLPENMPPLPCLGTQIMQVLLNLLSNAADAVEDQPIRKINVGVEMSSRNGQNFACFYVEDTGPGVPEAARSKIMNPFFTTKPVGKGTGLGLSISRSIAASHGGRLYLDTSTSHTRFVLEVPYTALDSQLAAALAGASLIEIKKPA